MSCSSIAFTISGAISLGAFEGGALAALLVAVQRIQTDDPNIVRIDAIGGASAGSIAGLLAARTLLAGLDPVRVVLAAGHGFLLEQVKDVGSPFAIVDRRS